MTPDPIIYDDWLMSGADGPHDDYRDGDEELDDVNDREPTDDELERMGL